MSKHIPLHEKIKLRLKVGKVIKVVEPDRLKGHASAVKACEDLGIKVREAFTVEAARTFMMGNIETGVTPLVQTNECLIMSDIMHAVGKDDEMMIEIRCVATRMGLPAGKKPMVIFVEQDDVPTPKVIIRDIEIIPYEMPTREEVSLELENFLKKNPDVKLEGNGTLPKSQKK